MRSTLTLCFVLATTIIGCAKEPEAFETGRLLQMDSIPCGTAEKQSKSVAGEIPGGDSGSRKTQEVLCQEYVLQGERVIFRIRPRDEKHAVLLPVGDRAQFRLRKDKLILRMEDVNNNEREYIVVSMTPRSDSNSADATPARVNHLQ